jgi:hypothetical protein
MPTFTMRRPCGWCYDQALWRHSSFARRMCQTSWHNHKWFQITWFPFKTAARNNSQVNGMIHKVARHQLVVPFDPLPPQLPSSEMEPSCFGLLFACKDNIMAMSSSSERSHSSSELESYEEKLIYKQRYIFLNWKTLHYSLSQRWRHTFEHLPCAVEVRGCIR